MSNLVVNRKTTEDTVTMTISIENFKAIIAALGLVTGEFEKDCGFESTYPLYDEMTQVADKNGIDYVGLSEWSIVKD